MKAKAVLINAIAEAANQEYSCSTLLTFVGYAKSLTTFVGGVSYGKSRFSEPKFKKAREDHQKLLGKSLHITVSDRQDHQDDYVSFVAMPGVAPGVFYASEAHRDAAATIIERVAKVLNYKAIPA